MGVLPRNLGDERNESISYDHTMMNDAVTGSDSRVSTIDLYRVTQTDPSTVRDFLSQKVLGIPLKHPTAKVLRLWDGLSVYRIEEQARARARETPRLGLYIAKLLVPLDDDRITVELDNGRNGHCTIWAAPGCSDR
jgi:hypothetical protein